MKRILSVLALFLAAGACTPKASSPEPVVKIESREVAGLLANDFAVLVDVREPEERSEMIAKARSMPMTKVDADDADFKQFAQGLPKDKKIVFHCSAGGRARRAAEKLAKMGYRTAYFDGPDEWKEAGLPTTVAGKK
jgi:rhodanese-related sulfurtransferase